jgi:hypothetical protein
MFKTIALLMLLNAPQPNSKGMVVHYKLWAAPLTATTFFDYSLNGNTGTMSGTSFVHQYPGVAFGGTDERLDTGATHQATFRASWSMSLWLKPDNGQPAAAVSIISALNRTGTDDEVDIRLQITGKVYFWFATNDNDSNPAETNAAVFTNGAQTGWTHLLFVADSTVAGVGGLVIYVNGVAVALDAANDGDTTGVTFSEYTSGANLNIGSYNLEGAYGDYLDASFGDFILYNRALAADEAKSLYESTRWRYQK